MSCVELLRTQAFVDGELDSAASADAERHLQSCDECQAFVAAAATAGDLVRRQAQRHTAPAALRRTVLDDLRAATPARPKQRGFWLGAGSGAGITALAAGLALFALLPPSALSLADAVTASHVSALMQNREIQVVSSDHHTVKPWFAGRIALSPPVTDFAAQGFRLTGGRLEKVAGRDMAVVVYQHGAHEMDLYVWAGAPVSGDAVRHGYHTTLWSKGDLNFAAVSDVDSTEQKKFITLVQAEPE